MNSSNETSITILNCSRLLECFQQIPGVKEEFKEAFVHVFILLPIALLGSVFNLLACLVLGKPEFKTRFFAFLRIYAFNSLCINVLDSFAYVQSWRYLGEIAQYYAATFYIYKVWYSLMITGYFFGSILDSIVVFERLKLVKYQKYAWMDAHSPLKVSVCLYLVCLAINLSMFFDYDIASYDFKVNSGESFVIYRSQSSDFHSSRLGKVTTLVQVFLRDVTTLVVEVVLNVWSIVATRTYLKRKNIHMAGHVTGSMSEPSSRLGSSLLKFATLNCVLSAVDHLLMLCAVLTSQFVGVQAGGWQRHLLNIALFIATSKHASTFFVLFIFNKVFCKQVRAFFCRSCCFHKRKTHDLN